MFTVFKLSCNQPRLYKSLTLNLSSEVVSCEKIEINKLSKFKTNFRQNEKKMEMADLHHPYHCVVVPRRELNDCCIPSNISG